MNPDELTALEADENTALPWPSDGHAADDTEGLPYEPPDPPEDTGPPRQVARYLKADERNVIYTREHEAVLLGPAAALAGGLALAIAGNAALLEAHHASPAPVYALWLAWLAAAAWSAWRWLEWRNAWFVVTADRLMTIRGLVRQRVDMLPLSKLRDLSMSQSVPGRLCGYGSFHCTSIGTDGPEDIHHLPDVDLLYTRVCELIMPASGRMGPGA
jgi:hypothetical protein